ncbi:MAG TPA: DUF5723 family protein [Bacteroidia bacterium]|nr:DUF5723 family protein [Bacteroidia bacterium]
MKKQIRALLAVGLLPLASYGQDFLGYANSNYAGVTGIHLNPASIADSRYKADIQLAGFNFLFQNNYVGFSKTALAHEGSYRDAIRRDNDTDKNTIGFPAFADPQFQSKYLLTRQDGKNKSVFLSNRVELPGFMASFSKGGFAVGLTSAVRTYVNVDGIEQPLANQLYADFMDSANWLKPFTNKMFSVQFMSWVEIGVTYAQIVIDDNEHFFKAGATPKLLLGLGSAYMYAKNLEYMTVSNDTLTFIHSEIEYSHSTNFEFPANGEVNYKVSSKPSVGLDFGMVYEWRPDWQDHKYDMDGETNLWRLSHNKYKLRVGLSITDLGVIRFERGEFSNNFIADVNNWNIDSLGKGLSSSDMPVRALNDSLRARFDSRPTDDVYGMNLPTAVGIQIDYQVWRDFYVNFNSYLAVQWKNNASKVHELTTVSITPRWDHRWFGVMIPFSYNQYRNFNLGACLRMGPLIIGTNHLATYLSSSQTIYGADLFFALKIPIMYREPRDKDFDKVSDPKDKCIDVPGIWEFLGCPDRDGDHVQDSEDLCPDIAGLKQFNGCPDRDNDGIIDSNDACPDDPGLQEFNGCPDKDGDKIIDKEDDCPDERGLAQFKGCPDRDGDGVMDKLDLCPEKPGPVDNEGCPEVRLHLVNIAGQSLSSIRQAKDGSFAFESLPQDSLCVFRLEGDPDKTIGVNEVKVISNGLAKRAIRSQVDGLFRFELPKPVDKGLKKEVVQDVPIVLTKEEAEVVKKAFDNLEFETGKAIIRGSSYASLDELAALLKKHPDWALRISGHTDNVGKPASNMKLSQKRSEAVRTYLIERGVSTDQLRTEWFGQTRPLYPNDTPEGRQKNRRVEMMIVDNKK